MFALSTFGDEGSVFQLRNLDQGCIKLYIESFHTEACTNNAIYLCVKRFNRVLLSFA